MWTKILFIIFFCGLFWAGDKFITPYFKDLKASRDYQAYQTKTLLNGIDVKPGEHEQALPMK